MISLLKILAPFAILAVGLSGAKWLEATAPEAESKPIESHRPLVETQTVRSSPQQLFVQTHGEVRPARSVALLAELAAKVVWTAVEFKQGAVFETGTLLLRLDPTDYELALDTAEAKVAQAIAALTMEEAEGQIARLDWQEIGRGEAPALAVREPQLAMAKANLRAAEAGVSRALRNLQRCEVRAPFSGRLQAKSVDLGQYLAPGSLIATLHANDQAEILLPLRLDQLAWLDLGLAGPREPIVVDFEARIGAQLQHWQGTIVRTSATLDPSSRMMHAIAVIDDPLALSPNTSHPPLSPGVFLRARIHGRTFPSVVTLPRSALRVDQTVLVIDAQDRLHTRKVEVLQDLPQQVHIAAGLEDGERVCLTPLNTVLENMAVQVLPTTTN